MVYLAEFPPMETTCVAQVLPEKRIYYKTNTFDPNESKNDINLYIWKLKAESYWIVDQGRYTDEYMKCYYTLVSGCILKEWIKVIKLSPSTICSTCTVYNGDSAAHFAFCFTTSD